jgi:hypothetical protein
MCFKSPSPSSPSIEGAASPQPGHLTSIIPDPAAGGRFSLHGLGTLLMPQVARPGFKHRNRSTALISPSRPTLERERHSKSTAESEWEDLGDADRGLDETKRGARLAAWTTLTSGVASHVVLGDESALSMLKRDEARSSPPAASSEPRSRTESISTASLSIELDAFPSVMSHLHDPCTPVADKLSTSVWEETQVAAMRSSTDLVHGSLESTNALADLIDKLGLDSSAGERRRLPDQAPDEGRNAPELPLRHLRKATLEQPVVPPAEFLLLPSPITPKCITLPASHPSTLDPSYTLTKLTLFSVRKGPSPPFQPMPDIEVKKSSTPAPKPTYLLTHSSCDNQIPDPPSPLNDRKSFLPDMSGSPMEMRPMKKKKRPSTAPQPFRLPLGHDNPISQIKGKTQMSGIFPKLLPSRSAKPLPPSPPLLVTPSRPRLLSQNSVAGAAPTRPSTPKARSEHRVSRTDGSDSGLEASFLLPIMPHKGVHYEG